MKNTLPPANRERRAQPVGGPQVKLQRLLTKLPRFMRPEFERINTLDDLLFQVSHEIDLAEEGDVEWSAMQLHRAKMYAATVAIEVQEAARANALAAPVNSTPEATA